MKRIAFAAGMAALIALSACGAEQEAEVESEGVGGELAGEGIGAEREGEEGAVLGEGEGEQEGEIAEGVATEGE